jgi:PAS domain S-box-containing protein
MAEIGVGDRSARDALPDHTGWRALVDQLESKVLLVGEDFTIVLANQAAQAMFGPRLEGRKCHEVFHGSSGKCSACPVDGVLNKGQEPDANLWIPCLHCRAIVPRRDAGRPGILGIELVSEWYEPRHAGQPATWLSETLKEVGSRFGRDPDGTKMMQSLIRRVLNRADAFLWNLIQSSVDAIIATDMRGNIFIFNNEATRILGYTTEEVIGRMHITDIYPIDTARDIMEKLRSDGHGGKNRLVAHDMEMLSKDGGRIPVRVNASLVLVNGEEFGSVGFFQDQRKRLKMEEELSRAQAQLLQAEKMGSLGRLAAGIAHQINNPLSGIVLFANLLLESPEIANVPEWSTDLRRVVEDAERCRAIVKELLEFARQTQQRLQPVDLNEALQHKIFLLEKQVLFQNIEMIAELDPDVPLIHVDPQQLDHVFMNLLINAAQAMDGHGTLTLRSRVLDDGELAELQVCDTGHGIPEDIRSRIFEPFFTTKAVGVGTGLGLSIVHSIVERHDGSIHVESTVGCGTTFTVRLPVEGPVGSKL